MSKALGAGPGGASLCAFYAHACAAAHLARMSTLQPPKIQGTPLFLRDLDRFRRLSDWLIAQVALHEPDAAVREVVLWDPVKLVHSAKVWACRAAHNHNPHLLASAVCLMGCGAHLLGTQSRCCSCFRMSESNSAFCRNHSQAEAALSKSTKPNLRIAEKISEKYGTEWMSMRTAHPTELLLGILWPQAAVQFHPEDWVSVITSVLRKTPLVRARLPKHFELMTLPRQLTIFRATLDPNEWSVANWPLKVVIAELWLAREREFASSRDMSTKNQERCKITLAFLAACTSQADAARRLDVPEDRLSQLLKVFKKTCDPEQWDIGMPIVFSARVLQTFREALSWQGK